MSLLVGTVLAVGSDVGDGRLRDDEFGNSVYVSGNGRMRMFAIGAAQMLTVKDLNITNRGYVRVLEIG